MDNKEFWSAVIRFQKSCPNPPLDGTNPHFGSKYTTLAQAIATAQEHLSAAGLAIVQLVEPGDKAVSVTTILAHESGQSLQVKATWPVQQNTPQSIASATTYAKRIGYLSILGKAGDADDDGNAAEGHAPKAGNGRQEAPRRPPVEQPKPNAPAVAADPAKAQHAEAVAQVRKLRAELDLTVPELMALCDGKASDQMTLAELLAVIGKMEKMLASRNNYEQSE